ncbi:molybdate transport system ATP-binding protein [Arboricoccus pini]|uniref:Molybdate transport system ATP-binding protein n=1 Tax=Arboricoccus pini TaxID=1963835 RepID=A0A212RZG0_9PROT|nr:molybdenum ABC transporter ATP-binding protein [Arboricoccus pini]SNB78281.1 molybdate transport system ATP-binding protein [Arboricoccus pini]
MSALEVNLDHTQGAFTLEVSFAAPDGVTALFGPSGSGKTTLVSLIAGLRQPRHGRIVVGEAVLLDTAKRFHLPPHRRRIGYVFQDARLFPHMTVRQNLHYGRDLAPADAVHQDESAIIELLGIGHLLDRRPAALSGGETQRVAIGRALLSAPRLLLMDEPLASLDQPRRLEILPYLERLCREARLPIVYVTHDVDEVVRLADTLVLLNQGRVLSCAPVETVLGDPALQRLTGRHEVSALLRASVQGPPEDGVQRLAHPAGMMHLPVANGLRVGASERLHVKARDVALATGSVRGLSIRNRLTCRIVRIEPQAGVDVLIELDAAGQRLASLITKEALVDLALAPGQQVVALIKAMTLARASDR